MLFATRRPLHTSLAIPFAGSPDSFCDRETQRLPAIDGKALPLEIIGLNQISTTQTSTPHEETGKSVLNY
jgi:hypothetical protein